MVRAPLPGRAVTGFPFLAAAFLITAITSAGLAADLEPRHVRPKPTESRLWPGLRDDLIVVKFVEGSEIRLRDGRLVSLAGRDLTSARRVLDSRSDLVVERLFTRPERSLESNRLRAQDRSGKEMADLNNYYSVRLLTPSTHGAESLLDELNALDIVEIAYAEPIPRVALLDVDDAAPRAPARRTVPAGAGHELGTPDFQPLQDYMESAPTGIDAYAAWTHPGGRGETVKVIDIEVGWNWDHEDMKTPFFVGGPVNYGDHGVAVVGEFASLDNGFGVTGISNAVDVGQYDVGDLPTADCFELAAAALDPGDIYVIELHCPGPEATGSGQEGYIALEWWQANFDVVATATANGVICVSAAGNGEADFDDPLYLGLFDRNVRDSGAIIVGATNGANLDPAWFTNHGARVDLAGWGFDVVTTGYGNLQGGPQNQWYTNSFSGTSSATPIIVGAMACMQGIYKAANGGAVLSGGAIAQLLRDTGTATSGPELIGPRPNLALAVPAMLDELAAISGQVTDSGDGQPIEGAEIRIVETGSRTSSAADGTYSLPISAGSWTVLTTKFGFADDSSNVVATAGNTAGHDVALAPRPTVSISGTVIDAAGNPVSGALVRLDGTPLPAVGTSAAGEYVIPNVPSPFGGVLYATATGFAPDARAVSIFGFPAAIDLRLGIANDFEADDGGLTGSNEWEWGTPTATGGPAAHSGVNVWGTDLDGEYALSDHLLTTPEYDLSGLTDPRASLMHWYQIWGPYDGANVSISVNGGTYQVIEPVGGYPDACIDGIDCEPGWTNSSGGWLPLVFDLNPYANDSVRFRFALRPWGFSNALGWYVDDFAVHGENSAVAVADTPPTMTSFLGVPTPSPVRGSTSVTFGLATAGAVDLRIFDTGGRQVRALVQETMAAGARTITWDGRDDRGRAVTPGVYFFRLRQPEADGVRVQSQKVVVID